MNLTRRPLTAHSLSCVPLLLIVSAAAAHAGSVGFQSSIGFDAVLCTGHGGPCSETSPSPSGLTGTYQDSINVPVGLGQFGQFAGTVSGNATLGASVGASSSVTLTSYRPDSLSGTVTLDNGLVDVGGASITSSWLDILTVHGAPAGYSVIATVSLHGSLSSTNDFIAAIAFPSIGFCDLEGSPCAGNDPVNLEIGDPVPPSISASFTPASDQFLMTLEVTVGTPVGRLSDEDALLAPTFVVTGTGSAQFGSTATLTSILFVDSQGNPIPGITITSDSGAAFPLDPRNAVAAVPEPGTVVMVAGTLLAIAARRRRTSLKHVPLLKEVVVLRKLLA